jgi:hypothetical protein
LKPQIQTKAIELSATKLSLAAGYLTGSVEVFDWPKEERWTLLINYHSFSFIIPCLTELVQSFASAFAMLCTIVRIVSFIMRSTRKRRRFPALAEGRKDECCIKEKTAKCYCREVNSSTVFSLPNAEEQSYWLG